MLKVLILLVLITPLILYSFRKKTFLYCVFALVPILPDSFAIEVSESLPLITATRVLICCVVVEWLIKKRDRESVYLPKLVICYILFNVLISAINLMDNTGEINRMFILIVEQLVLVVVVAELIDTKELFYECLDALLYGSLVLAVVGIMQTVLEVDLASVLVLVESAAEVQLPGRMGVIRAYGTSNAIAFGCYCAMMILVALYRYEHRKRMRYLIVCVANMVALLLTMTRSALLAIGLVLVLMVIVRNAHMIRKYLRYIPLIVIGGVVVIMAAPQLLDSAAEMVKSVLNVFGANLDLSENFGVNADNAVSSRTLQWSAVYYMIQEGKGLFGYGYAAYARGCLMYFFEQFGEWTPATALDVGFVGIATESGILGLLSRIVFLCGLGFKSLLGIKSIRGLEFENFFVYFLVLYVILNFASSVPDSFVLWLVIALFFAYRKEDRV